MWEKADKNLFETELKKELGWTVDMSGKSGLGVEKLVPMGFPVQLFDRQLEPGARRMGRVDSYRVPPPKMTLETIEEDQPGYEKPDYLSRSKSLPGQRRFPMDCNGHAGLHRLPSYRPGHDGAHLAQEGCRAGDGCLGGDGYHAGDMYRAGDGYRAGDCYRAGEGGYGVTMSGPILSNPSEYKYSRKHHRARISISRMREAITHSRFREAFTNIFSRMRPKLRRSH